MTTLTNPTSPAVAVTPADRQECPICTGRGEVMVPGTDTPNEWGVADPDFSACRTCSGTGALPNDVLVCEVCEDAFAADDSYCDHGMTLCPNDVSECQVCASEIAFERYCDDPWWEQ